MVIFRKIRQLKADDVDWSKNHIEKVLVTVFLETWHEGPFDNETDEPTLSHEGYFMVGPAVHILVVGG